MSYCVNCGVELDSSAKKCALCDTPVYHPLKKIEKDVTAPFSDSPMVPANMKSKFVAVIVTYILLVPNIVCALINVFTNPDNLWFIYVASTSALLWVLFVVPFLVKKQRPYLMWVFDTLAVSLYVLVFYSKNFGGGKWYFYIALPIILIVSACVLAYIYWMRKRRHHWTSKVLHVFVDLVISLTVTSLCFWLNGGEYLLASEICSIIDVCCIALLFFWIYANKSKKVRAWLERKVFV